MIHPTARPSFRLATFRSELLAIWLVWQAACLWGMPVNRSFRQLTVADGLSNNSVKAIYQDSLGFVWLGTKNGLNRFDGYRFRNYPCEDASFVGQTDDVVQIIPDGKGNLLIGTFNGIIAFNPYTGRYQDLGATYQGELPRGVVVGIWVENGERTWVATKTGLYVLDGHKSVPIEALRGKYINAMTSDGRHTLLLDIVQYGLVGFDVRTQAITPYLAEPDRPTLTKMFLDRRGRLWGASDLNHLFRIDATHHRLERLDVRPPCSGHKQVQVHDLHEYNDSTLLLATDNGLYALRTGHHTALYVPTDLLPTDLLQMSRQMALFQDAQQSWWIGTFNEGVLHFNPQGEQFRFYRLEVEEEAQQMPLRVVGRMMEHDQKVWVVSNKGIGYIDLRTGRTHSIDWQKQVEGAAADAEPYCAYPLDEHRLLFYLLNHGTYCLDLRTARIARFNTGLPGSAQIRAFSRDYNGRLWIAQDELSVFDLTRGQGSIDLSTNYEGTTRFMYTQDIQPYGKGMLVGTRTRGVWLFPWDDENPLHYFRGEPWGGRELGNKNVCAVYADPHGRVWVGTYGSGLYRCRADGKVEKHFTQADALPNNTVCDVVQDREGHVWAATLTGIVCFVPDGRVLAYTERNGFPLNELSGHAFLQASNGNLFVGGKNGVAEVLLDKLRHTPQTDLHVRIAQVETLDSPTATGHLLLTEPSTMSRIELGHGSPSIQILFSAMDYLHAAGIQYAYRMEGIEKEWNHTDRAEAIYTNLAAGEYTFEVKACGPDGVWGKQTTKMVLVVHPPLWLSTGAKTAYCLGLIALLGFIARYYYLKKTSQYRLQIETMEKENLERNYRTKIELFTNYSHELRTPLTLIKGPAEDLLNHPDLPPQFAHPVGQICKNANRLLLLVNQLMDVRKLEHGAMRLNLSALNAASFMTECIDSFTELANKRNITIRYTNDYFGNDWWADADLMEKVVLNLLSNALKHSANDSTIQVASLAQDGKLRLTVRDYGEGIAPEYIDKIFDPFFQVRQGNVGRLFGSGIGLSLAKYVVGLHHGRIWAESRPGEGATFFVELALGREAYTTDQVTFVEEGVDPATLQLEKGSVKPLDTASSNPLADAPGNDSGEELEGIVILVAEDDEDLRHYLIDQLENTYHVLTAPDGQSGLELATEKLPDLILSDIMMPHMDGMEFCTHIKNNPQTAHIPFLMLTAKAMDEHIRAGYAVLADDYILKPFNPSVLKAKIQSMLQNRIRLRRLFEQKMMAVDVGVPEIASTDPFMDKLIDLIRERAADTDLQVSDLYEAMGYGRMQFFRKIKAVSGLSPNKLIVHIRMKMAADLLRDSQYTIAEVAYQTGFSDPSYFSRVFKQVFQITPTEFQRKQADGH